MSSSIFDYCILGAGIAGLSLADSLNDLERTVCIIETHEIASGASGTPLGMVNPATGRGGTKTWRAEKCYAAIADNLRKVSSFSEKPFYHQNGVLRPALTSKIAGKMREQFEKTQWPDGWCQWLTESDIQIMHPGIQSVGGGLWLPVGITVDVEGYLTALAKFLSSENIKIITGAYYKLEKKKSSWTISIEKLTIECSRLIFATGYGTTFHPWWKDLPLYPIKGQIAVFKPENPLTFEHSISSLGYFAQLDDQKFACGSTYEHDFDSVEPDAFGEEYLRKRLRQTLPDLEKRSRLIRQWAGVRLSSPNRKPVLGKHRKLENLYIFTALGSKGLLYGKFLADHFANYLVKGTPLPKAVLVERL